MSVLTEDGIYNDTYIDCVIVKDNIISLLIHDKKNSVTRSYKFESVEKAEELVNKLLHVIFDVTEKNVVKNKRDITQEEWRVIDQQRWETIKSKILDFNDYIHLHSFIKTLSVIEILDGSSLFLVSNAFGIVDKNILIASCMAIMYADSVGFDDDGNIVEIGERLWSIHINFKNTKQKEFEYMQ